MLAQVRDLVTSAKPAVRRRLIQVLAWQGDALAIPILTAMKKSDREEGPQLDWALRTIGLLQFDDQKGESLAH